MNKILDIYYRWPLQFDAMILAITWIINYKFDVIQVIASKAHLNEIISDMIDTSVSLAGFILAALTIIVTFKSNLKSKGIDDANNAFEMIFSSKHYENIVTTFKYSILELTILFILLYSSTTFSDNLNVNALFQIVISGVVLIALSIFRSLLLLFRILKIEFKAN